MSTGFLTGLNNRVKNATSSTLGQFNNSKFVRGTKSFLSSNSLSMYVELEPCCRKEPSAYYFDSVGTKPTKEVHKLVSKLKDQYKSIKNKELEFLYNDIPHQRKDTECGIYCLHFLETMLKGTDFDDYIQNKRGDEYMQKFRSYFFAK